MFTLVFLPVEATYDGTHKHSSVEKVLQEKSSRVRTESQERQVRQVRMKKVSENVTKREITRDFQTLVTILMKNEADPYIVLPLLHRYFAILRNGNPAHRC